MNSNTISIIIVTLIVAAGAYWYFFMGTGNDAPITETTTGVTDSAEQIKFQALVRQLQPIKFDTSIFDDPKFASLIEITTPTTPEMPGGTDPFATIPRVAGR